MTEHSLSVTLKAGKDFDSPWVVVYGNEPGEVEFKLDNIEGVLQKATSAAAAFRALHTLESSGVAVQAVATEAPAAQQPAGWGNSAPAAQPQWSQSAAPAAPSGPVNGSPHPEHRACSCGQVLQYKAFNSKAGKALKMWACPNQRAKGDGHVTEWID